jgi:predicted MFS family arabinose efflux permease
MAISPATTRAITRPRGGVFSSPSLVLFLAFFASQAGVLVLSPILSDVADDLGVSVAQAGQLRILAAPLAVLAALAAGRLLVRFSPRALLGAGSALLALGSSASAVAPSFDLLALAQVPMWIGIATLLTAGVAATSSWSEPERRTRIVSHALAGPPAAWIVGMPIIGLVAEVDWRLAFLAFPLPAALLAGLALAARPGDHPIRAAETSLRGLLRRPAARRWALGELLANSAWAGTLVFSGALLTEQYGMSTAATGVALAAVAVAYLAGNRRAGRLAAEDAMRAMLVCSVGAAVLVALTWSFTPALVPTLVVFAASGAVVATRTVAGTVYGFAAAGDLGREVGTARAVTTQLGYLIGAMAGGAALAVGGFALLGVVFGGIFVASTVPSAAAGVASRREPRPTVPPPVGFAPMPTRCLRLAHGRDLVVRPLANGDVQSVAVVFERLGERSRRLRYNGPKPELAPAELEWLAAVDHTRHTLVGYLAGDDRPVALARLVRDGSSAENAVEEPDEYKRLGNGSGLTAELLADARAAGVTEVTSLVSSENQAAVKLLRRVLGRLEVSFDGPELSIRAALA